MIVDSVTCEAQSRSVASHTPKGKYCEARLKLLNRSRDAHRPLISWIVSVEDRRFPGEDSIGRLFPDEEVELAVIFDIPVEATPTELEAELISDDFKSLRWTL